MKRAVDTTQALLLAASDVQRRDTFKAFQCRGHCGNSVEAGSETPSLLFSCQIQTPKCSISSVDMLKKEPMKTSSAQ